MAHVITDNQYYINIANAIRDNSFGNIEGPLPVTELSQCIREISTIGQAEGKAEGYAQGIEDGRKIEHEAFWEHALSKDMNACGSRFAGRSWNDYTFRPTKDIKPTSTCANMFNACAITDLAGILRSCGVQLDISGVLGRVDNMFGYSPYLTTVPFLDVRNSTRNGTSELSAMFDTCPQLHTIEGIYLKEDGSTGWGSSAFYGCSALENLTIYGTIGRNGLNISWSTRLTHDSLMSIINALQDKTGDTSASWAVTLGADNLAKLTDAEKAIATQRGWTLA